jgi:hypothetical protein
MVSECTCTERLAVSERRLQGQKQQLGKDKTKMCTLVVYGPTTTICDSYYVRRNKRFVDHPIECIPRAWIGYASLSGLMQEKQRSSREAKVILRDEMAFFS